jgi:hypothetical protein
MPPPSSYEQIKDREHESPDAYSVRCMWKIGYRRTHSLVDLTFAVNRYPNTAPAIGRTH